MERFRRLFGLLIVIAVAGAVALVVVVRPGLRDDAESVDRSWTPLVQPLDARYQKLDAIINQLKLSGAGTRTATVGLATVRERWRIIRSGTDSADQVETANRIEEFAARATALAHSARLAGVTPLQLAVKAFDQTRPTEALLATYNDDVNAYQHRRDGFWSQIVAGLDGYPMRPTLQLVS